MIYNAEKHEIKDKYPNKSDFMMYYVYKKGLFIIHANASGIKDMVWKVFNQDSSECSDNLHLLEKNGYVIEYDFDEESFNEYKVNYARKVVYLRDCYKKELFDEEGINISEINERIWCEAWERSRSEGFGAVEVTFDELIDFAKDIIKMYNKHKEN